MTFDDHILDAIRDGNEDALRFAEENPGLLAQNFWQRYLELLEELKPSPERQLAERLILKGAVHGLTRISDIPSIVEDEYQSNERDA